MSPEAGIPDRVVPMKVIVCGVQRTGTLSVRHALFRLGIHDCYHMHTVRDNPETDGVLWTRAIKAKYAGEGSFEKEDWDKLLGQHQAVCDVPSAFFGPELAELYPDAKVVILNRDPEKWYDSVLNSIHRDRPVGSKLTMLFCLASNPETRAWVKFAMTMLKYCWGYDHRSEKDKAMAWYKNTYDDFRERIPAERRIEYSVQDGWKPLCDLLDVPVPMDKDPKTGELVEAPFPHLNDRYTFQVSHGQVQAGWAAKGLENVFTLIGKAAVLGTASYGGYLLWKTRLGGRF